MEELNSIEATKEHIAVFFIMFSIGSVLVFAGTERNSDGYRDYYVTQAIYWVLVFVLFSILFGKFIPIF